MKDKNKLRTKIFRFTLSILFAIFITLFISNEFGYFEYQKHEQITLTQEQIEKFEQDVKEGKNISLEDYVNNTNKNYQTNFSQMGLNLSNKIADTIKSGVEMFFSSIDKLVTQ